MVFTCRTVLVADIYQCWINVLKGSPDSVISVNIRLMFITGWIYALYCQQSYLKYVFLDPFNKWFPIDMAVQFFLFSIDAFWKKFLTHKAVCLTIKASYWPSNFVRGDSWLVVDTSFFPKLLTRAQTGFCVVRNWGPFTNFRFTSLSSDLLYLPQFCLYPKIRCNCYKVYKSISNTSEADFTVIRLLSIITMPSITWSFCS